jgi:NAD(P)-dependent dehydrogenase (short-subunit alcohol dehydrogenase family)
MNTLTPKIALITGGSRGLGRNTAENLATRLMDWIWARNTRREEGRAR